MPKVIPLDPASEWVELSSTEEDWDRLPSRLLMTMLVHLYLIRAFEEEVLQLAGQGLIHGPAHSSIGQEGGAVGSCLSLRSDDQVTGSHRGHHQFLAKALGHVAPNGLEPTTDLPPAVREVLERSLARVDRKERHEPVDRRQQHEALRPERHALRVEPQPGRVEACLM